MYSFDYDIEEVESSNYDLFNNNNTISLNETDRLNDIYPFRECEGKILEKMEKFKKFYISRKNTDKQRKEKEDNIRKKIKSNFHKNILIIINTQLKQAGSKLYFQSLPQSFISDITKKSNCDVLEITYKDLFEFIHERIINGKNYKKDKNKAINKAVEKKYIKNIETLKYLENNPEISEKSGWSRIKNMKYEDLLNAYFKSKEFEQNIEKLEKKETKNYINDYIHFSLTYIDHYKSFNSTSLLNNNSNNQINNSNTQSISYNGTILSLTSLPFPIY